MTSGGTVSISTSAVALDQLVVLAAVQLVTSPPITSPPGITAAQTAQLYVLRPRLVNFNINLPLLVGVRPATGVVVLTGPLPQSGMTLSFASDNTNVAPVPMGPINVPAGADTFSIPINSTLVQYFTQLTIIAVLRVMGTNTVECIVDTLTVQPTMSKGSFSKEANDKDMKESKDKDKDKEKEGKEGKDKDKEKDKNKGKEGHIEVMLPPGTEWRRSGAREPLLVPSEAENPLEWARVLALRIDDSEKQFAGVRAFIGPRERPEVGRKAIDQAERDGSRS